ncbi:hypothetical protein NXC24_CH03873 [Rhizobium sp. NXC24]|nr:hypothetical protein NXC24_CH03873 [Rhizobium sp. NXC24]
MPHICAWPLTPALSPQAGRGSSVVPTLRCSAKANTALLGRPLSPLRRERARLRGHAHRCSTHEIS